jgi:hypothetical protein
MADRITIIYNTGDENTLIADLLDTRLKEAGKYETIIKTQTEYTSANFEDELLGTTAADKPLIFIGKANTTLINNIHWTYDEYGMKYGWKRRQAVLLVEKRKWNEAESAELVKLLDQVQESNPKNGLKDQIDKISGKVNKLPVGLKIAGAVAGTALFGVAAAAVAGSALLINNKINNDKLFESQQKYLVNRFITMALDEFMK